MKRLFLIILSIILVLSLAGCSSTDYKTAIELFNLGQYKEAAAIFESLDDYKNSAEFLTMCNYNIALSEYENGNYSDALRIFNAISNYQDSSLMITKCEYELGMELYEQQDYNLAAAYFYGLGNYEDSEYMYKACKYKKLISYIIENGEYLSSEKWYYFEDMKGANAYQYLITDGEIVMYKDLASWETYDSDFFFGYTCTYTIDDAPYFCLQYYDCELTYGVITDGEAIDMEGHIDITTGKILDIQYQDIVNTNLDFAKRVVTETQERSLEFVDKIIERSGIGLTLEELFG